MKLNIMTKIYIFLVVERDLLKCKKEIIKSPPRKLLVTNRFIGKTQAMDSDNYYTPYFPTPRHISTYSFKWILCLQIEIIYQ